MYLGGIVMKTKKILSVVAALCAVCALFFACGPKPGGDDGGGGFTVTFNSNGGSNVASISGVESGTGIDKPADPTKDGFDFAGWYKEAALTTLWNFASDPVTANTTLYAKWVAEGSTFTVTFNSTGGSAVATLTGVESGARISAPAAPTRSGFTFDGWFKEVTLTTQWNFNTDTVTASITLYAKWTSSGGDIVPLTGFSIDTSISVERQATKQLTPVFTPLDATEQTVAYTSANVAVATVHATSGVVTGVAKGNTTITARPNGNPAYEKTVQVTVTLKDGDKKPGDIGLKESGGDPVQTTFTVTVGGTKEFVVDWGTQEPTVTDVTWVPSGNLDDKEKHRVFSYAYPDISSNKRPRIKGVGPGTQKFIVTSVMDPDYYKEITIVVANKTGYADPVKVPVDNLTDKSYTTQTMNVPVRDLTGNFNWGHITEGDHYTGDGKRLTDADGYTHYTAEFENALSKNAGTLKSKIVFYYYKNYDNGTYGGSTAHYLQIGWTQKGVGQIDGGVAVGQPVFRFEFPVEEFLRYENYVGTAGPNGIDGDGSQVGKITGIKNASGGYDPCDFKDYYENTEEWYALNNNKQQFNYAGRQSDWGEASFSHVNLGRVVLEVTRAWTAETGAYLLDRIEFELPE
jgi:uncharacterized repeat protein (TIGR02543 family)